MGEAFGPPLATLDTVFERFTERARQVMVLAQDEARALRHNYIGSEHILLGLFREEEGLAARVLESFGMTVEQVRAEVRRTVGEGDDVTSSQIPFTPRAKRALELALREALNLGHNYVGTEHILLGLARLDEGVAIRILRERDADAARVRDEVIRMLSEPARRVPVPASVTPLDLASLVTTLAHAQEALAERQQFEAAAELRRKQRRLVLLAVEIQTALVSIDPPLDPPPSARDADAARWQYDVKQLEGASDTWPDQLSALRREGWELLAIVRDREARVAIVERRI